MYIFIFHFLSIFILTFTDIKNIKLEDIKKVSLKQYNLFNTKHSIITIYPKYGKKISVDMLHEFNDFQHQFENATGILNLLAPYIMI